MRAPEHVTHQVARTNECEKEATLLQEATTKLQELLLYIPME